MKTAHPIPKIFAVLLLLAGAIIIVAYYYVVAGGLLPFSGKLYNVTAQIADTQGLQKHADIRDAGIKIGTVNTITNEVVPSQGTVARIQMDFNPGFGPLYKDATVLIRQKTLVGENYIQVTRGDPKSGKIPNGGVLPMSHDLGGVSLDKILNALTPEVRKNISGDLRQFGAAVDGEGQKLNDFFGNLQPAVVNGTTLTRTLAAQKQQVASLIDQTGTVFNSLASRTQSLQTLIRAGKHTAEAVAARDTALSQGLVDLPSTLSQARTSVNILSSFSNTATPVISNLRVAVTKLDPAIHVLQPTAVAARALFNDLPPFLRRANPLLVQLKRFAGHARPAIRPLDSFLGQANPILKYLQPFSADLGSFLLNFGGSPQLENSDGTYIGRCLCPISAASFGNFTPQQQAFVRALIKAGGLGGIANPVDNVIRPAGTQPNAGIQYSGTYPQVKADPPTRLPSK